MKKFNIKDTDTLIRLVLPKVVKVGLNILQMGPRILMRSAVSVLRANMATRIISALSLLVLDVVDLRRKRISKSQFVRNVFLSIMLVLSGTLGWYAGSSWLVLEVLGVAAEIVGGIIGAAVLVAVSGKMFDIVCNKFHTADSEKIKRLAVDLYPESAETISKFSTSDCKKILQSGVKPESILVICSKYADDKEEKA